MSRKVCLMTWYGYKNYGTFLQAYAMYTFLSKKYNVVMLNRFQYYSFIPSIIKFLKKIKKEISSRKKLINSRISFENEQCKKNYFNEISINNKKQFDEFNKSISHIVIGGDQLWNPFYLNTKFLVDFKTDAKIVSYGTSFGVERLNKKFINKYKKYLKRFDCINVREDSGVKIVTDQLKLNANQVLDSVFLIEKNEWIETLKKESKIDLANQEYIFCYFVNSKKEYFNEIKRRYINKKIIVVPMKDEDFVDGVEVLNNIGPFDFLNYLYNAEMIITDSFHAASFSIIFQKNFNVIKRFIDSDIKSQNSRIISLLSFFELNNKLVDISKLNYDMIDFQKVLSKLEIEKERCFSIIDEMIK